MGIFGGCEVDPGFFNLPKTRRVFYCVFLGLIVELSMFCWIIMREVKLDHVRGIIRVVNRRYSNCRKTTSSRDTFAEFIWGCPSNQRLYLWVTQPPSQWQIKSLCCHPYTKKCNVTLVVTTEKEEQPNLQPPEVSHASPENQPSLEISEFPSLQVNHPFNCWGCTLYLVNRDPLQWLRPLVPIWLSCC